jgi:CubicO group peptidase (beta-lactamase class C family)
VAYHAITSGFLIDELIRVTTGLDAQQYLDRHIRKPMGMQHFRYGFDLADRDIVATNYLTGLPSDRIVGSVLEKALSMNLEEAVDFSNDPRFFDAIVPSANLYATAEETSRFLQMLLDHGQWQGAQILDPLTVYRATREVGKMGIDKTLLMPMRYSAGAMLGGSPVGFYGRNTQHAYGHIGLSNIFCWADPERSISVAILNTGKPILGPHIKIFLSLIGLVSSSCPRVVDMRSDEPHYQPTYTRQG